MNRLLNVTLVLSLIVNVLLGLTRNPTEAVEPALQHVESVQNSILPLERASLPRASPRKKAVRSLPAVAVPWALVKEGHLRAHRIDFEIPNIVTQGLELTRQEQRAVDRAVNKMKKALREIELAGLQQSDGLVVQVELDPDGLQVALQDFVAEIEQSLPVAKATILSEAAAADNYLKWPSLSIGVSETKNGMRFKFANFNRSGRGGGSQSRTLTSRGIPDLRERWGHLIDIARLEEILKTREARPQP